MPLISRKQFLASAVGAAAAPAVLGRAQSRPNIVVIVADDHAYNFMGNAGHPWLKTPNLDRLAANGVRFDNAFVTTSLCSPSRASILTGQYAHSHGVLDNETELPRSLPNFAQVLQASGYRTAMIGKWHMGEGSDAPRPGFDRWASFRGQGDYFDPTINFDGNRRKVSGYVTHILTDEAIRFVNESRDRPFLLYLGHKACHADFYPEPKYKTLYATEPIPYPASMADTGENYRGKPEWLRRQRNSYHGVDAMYNHQISFEQYYRDYCRVLQSLDDGIGALYDELGRRGLLENTLILYMGDNGLQFGEHGIIDKRTMYEHSIRVPMIAHFAGRFQAGGRVRQMALNLDVCPTVIEATGARVPSTVHGRSLLPLLEGRTGDWRTEFLYEYFWERAYPQTPTVLGLRTDRYSFMNYHGVWCVDELYDIQKDPEQMHNLLGEVVAGIDEGPFFNFIPKGDVKELVRDLTARRNRILEATGGRPEPAWSGFHNSFTRAVE